MYGSMFCRLYNEFGWNEYPRVLGEQLLEWLNRSGIRVASALDLGCGTGVLCGVLHDAGIRTLGVDLSPDMIAIARNAYPDLRFEVADMTTYHPDECYDLITCTGDALNHIFDPEAVSQFFRCARSALNGGGYLIFDLLDESEIPEGEPFEADYNDITKVRFHAENDGQGNIRLNIQTLENDRMIFEENILEKLHDRNDILCRLEDAGYEVVQCSDRLLEDSAAHGTTTFVVARAKQHGTGH